MIMSYPIYWASIHHILRDFDESLNQRSWDVQRLADNLDSSSSSKSIRLLVEPLVQQTLSAMLKITSKLIMIDGSRWRGDAVGRWRQLMGMITENNEETFHWCIENLGLGVGNRRCGINYRRNQSVKKLIWGWPQIISNSDWIGIDNTLVCNSTTHWDWVEVLESGSLSDICHEQTAIKFECNLGIKAYYGNTRSTRGPTESA